jgi:hypothetical protein
LTGLACVIAGTLLAALTPVVFGSPRPMIRVTWRAIDPPTRRDLEQRFALAEAIHLTEATWGYVPLDTSTRMLRSIVAHPLVAETDGINRRALAIADDPPLTPRRGGMWAHAPAGAARLTLLAAYVIGALGLGALTFVLLPRGRVSQKATRGRALTKVASKVAVPVGVLLLFAVVVAYRYLSFEYVSNDHFTYLTFAHQSALGDLPVRDYDDPGFPLMIALSAIAMRLGGMTLLPEVVLTAAMFGLAACITWLTASAVARMPFIALIATLLQVLAYPRPYSYPKILIPACAVALFFAYARTPGRKWLFALALLAEVGLLLRHDLAVYLSFATVLLLLFVHRLTRAAVERVLLYVAACVVLTIPYLLYLLTFGFDAHLAAAFGFSSSEAARTSGWTSVLTSGSPLALTLLMLPLVVLLWLVIDRSRRGRWTGEVPALAATAVLMLTINIAMLRDTTPTRLADVFGAAPVLFAWLGAQMIARMKQARNPVLRAAGFAAVATAGIALVVSTSRFGEVGHYLAEARLDSWRGATSHAVRQTSLLTEWPWTGKYQGVAQEPLARYINRCTSRNQTVLIVGYLPHLPVAARRLFAGGHAWLLPGYFNSESDQARMARRLAERPPAIVVIQPEDATTLEQDWPSIARLLTEYREPQEFDGLQVRTAKNLPVRGVHPDTGLACLW